MQKHSPQYAGMFWGSFRIHGKVYPRAQGWSVQMLSLYDTSPGMPFWNFYTIRCTQPTEMFKPLVITGSQLTTPWALPSMGQQHMKSVKMSRIHKWIMSRIIGQLVQKLQMFYEQRQVMHMLERKAFHYCRVQPEGCSACVWYFNWCVSRCISSILMKLRKNVVRNYHS